MFNFLRSKPKDPVALCFKTDIHCHLVPGVDDGSPDAVTSADLIERMQGWGIERIIASPHVTDVTFPNNPATIEAAMGKLREELSRRGNDIKIDHSAEYRIDDLFYNILEGKDSLMLLPDNYILIENSFMQEPGNLAQLIFDLQVKGLRPILVHPERYNYYYTKKNRYSELHNAGTLFQINLLSLAKAYGKTECKIAEYLLKEGMVDFVGTDLHNASHADAIDSYLRTSDARAHMADLAHVILNDKVFR